MAADDLVQVPSNSRAAETAAGVTPPAEHAARRPAGAADAVAADADVESVEKVIFEEKKGKGREL